MIDSGCIILRVGKNDAWLAEKLISERAGSFEWFYEDEEWARGINEYQNEDATDLWDDELKYFSDCGLDFICLREGSMHRLPSTVISFDGEYMEVQCDCEWYPVVSMDSENRFIEAMLEEVVDFNLLQKRLLQAWKEAT